MGTVAVFICVYVCNMIKLHSKKCWVIFFNPNASFSLWGHFIRLFLIFFNPGAGLFFCTWAAGLFFCTQPLGWASDETIQLLTYSKEGTVLSAADLKHFFSELKVCICFI